MPLRPGPSHHIATGPLPMDVLVYARGDCLERAVDAFSAPLTYRDHIEPRNAAAHADGQVEPADRVHVDDRYPWIADDYRDRSDVFVGEVELFDAGELGAPEPPEPDGDAVALDADAFASPTAHDVAVEAGLGPDAFDGVEPAGKTGYTTAQVREMVG